MIEDRTTPYELLVRFDENGAVSGAHFIRRRIVYLDGEKLKEETLSPVAMQDLSGEDEQVVESVLGETLVGVLVHNAALQQQLSELLEREEQPNSADGFAVESTPVTDTENRGLWGTVSDAVTGFFKRT
jgi:hypothetical protein